MFYLTSLKNKPKKKHIFNFFSEINAEGFEEAIKNETFLSSLWSVRRDQKFPFLLCLNIFRFF